MYRKLVCFALVLTMIGLFVGPVYASSSGQLPPKLRQFAQEKGLEFRQTRTDRGHLYYEFSRDNITVIVSQEYLDTVLEGRTQSRKDEPGVQGHPPGNHDSFWRCWDMFWRGYELYILCQAIYDAMITYGLRTGTGYENGPYYDYPVADIVNGVVNWR